MQPGLLVALGLFGQTELLSPMPIAFVERPLTVPSDSYELFFTLGGSQLDANSPIVFAETGAGYGITDDFEIGLRLLRVSFSPARNTGLNNPMGYLAYRFLSGVVELGGYLEAEIPVGGVYEANAKIDLLLHLGSVARIDLAPGVGVLTEQPKARFVGTAPLELTFQIGEHVKLSALGIVELPDLSRPNDVLGRAGIRFAYTFGSDGKADVDLGILVTTPNFALAGERPEDPALNNYFLGLVDLSWFLANDASDPWRGVD